MKRPISIVFCLVIMWPFIGKTAFMVWYKANKSYVAQNLCENKNNSERSDCEGCCFVNKQLNKLDNKQENNGQPLPSSEINNKETPNFFFEKNIQFSIPKNCILVAYGNAVPSLANAHLQQLIKPPCC